MEVIVRIQTADFDVGAQWQALKARAGGDVGAVASFVGLVRDRHQSKAVTRLHLEHYPGMTEDSIKAIINTAGERWPLLDVVVVHRVGALAATEQIVFVQVAAGHRAAAFQGAEFIMDYLKTDAVIWKREDTGNASRWIKATAEDQSRRAGWKKNAPEG
jgi:molybdopterin synthase catalytic subunit